MGCDGRSGWSADAYAAAWASEAVAAIGSGVGALGWEVIASLPPGRLVVGVDAAHRDQGRPRSRILASRPCRAAWSPTGPAMAVWPAVLVAADSQAVEPGRPAGIQHALDADLVVHRRLRRGSPPPVDQPVTRAMAASRRPPPATHRSQMRRGGPAKPTSGLLERLLLALHAVVVAQRVGPAGAFAAVAGVKVARLVLVLDQHGCSVVAPARPAGSDRRGGVGAAHAATGLAASARKARRPWRLVPVPTSWQAGDAACQAPPVGLAAKLDDPPHGEGDPQLVLVHLDPIGWRWSDQHARDPPKVGHPPKVEQEGESSPPAAEADSDLPPQPRGCATVGGARTAMFGQP